MSRHGLTPETEKAARGGVHGRERLHVVSLVALLCAAALVRVCAAQTLHAVAAPRVAGRQSLARPVPTPRPARPAPTPEQPSPFFDMVGGPFKGKKLARANAPMIGLVASASAVELCAGAEGSARVRLTASGFDPEGRPLRYRWAASVGRVGGAGNEAMWDLSGAGAGVHTASVALETSAGDVLARKETSVAVRACRAPRRVVSCPSIALCCRASVTEGSPAPFIATLDGGTQGVTPNISWRLSAGRALTGLAAPRIELDTAGLGGRTVLATVEAEGYGLKCSSTCATVVMLPAVDTNINTDTNVNTDTNDGHPLHARKATVAMLTPSPSPSPSPTPQAVATYFRPLLVLRVMGSLWVYIPWLLLLAAIVTAFTTGVRARGGSPAPDVGDQPAAPAPLDGSPSPDGSRSLDGSPSPVPTPTPDAPVTLPAGLPCEAAAGEAAATASDEVHCTVFAPPSAMPGDQLMVQVFAHLAEQAHLLAGMAADYDPDAKKRMSEALESRIEREKRLSFSLELPGLLVSPPSKSLVWRGETASVSFQVSVPEGCKPRNVVGMVNVYCENAPVGAIVFKLQIAAANAPQVVTTGDGSAHSQEYIKYKFAFISYCHADCEKVFTVLQGLKAAWDDVGTEYFIDEEGIRTGTKWSEVIEKNIARCDVVILFWSSAAQASEEVKKEIRFALTCSGGVLGRKPVFKPITIEWPLPAPPPELQQIEFTDHIITRVKLEEMLREAAAQKSTAAP